MSIDANIETLKDAYQRWHNTRGGSVDHWLKLMTDDVQFRSLAGGAVEMQFTRPSCCKEDVVQYFAGLTSEWEMIYYRVDEYIAQALFIADCLVRVPVFWPPVTRMRMSV